MALPAAHSCHADIRQNSAQWKGGGKRWRERRRGGRKGRKRKSRRRGDFILKNGNYKRRVAALKRFSHTEILYTLNVFLHFYSCCPSDLSDPINLSGKALITGADLCVTPPRTWAADSCSSSISSRDREWSRCLFRIPDALRLTRPTCSAQWGVPHPAWSNKDPTEGFSKRRNHTTLLIFSYFPNGQKRTGVESEE